MKLRLLFSLLFSSLLLSGFSQSIGLIGTASPLGNWDADVDMTQDAADPTKWTLVANLNEGACKFRQDNAWDINWGDSAFPFGTGTQGGPDIAVPTAGEYTITFNSATGAYSFQITSDIGILGSATFGGWDFDTNMAQDPTNPDQYSITLNLLQGACKFRANDSWDINWGGTDFPSGVGTQGGADIQIPAASKYIITFNKATGAYNFEEKVEFNTIGIIGDATAGGWAEDTDLSKDPSNPNLWKKNGVQLKDGSAKFRANDAWTLNWGGTDFPTGIAVPNGDNIPVDSGEYLITFNTQTLEYSFLPIVTYQTIGIIGSATPGGWDNDTDMVQDPSDKSLWKLRIVLTEGEAKFRAENDWGVNWGNGDFPSGVALPDGANIPVPAGEYVVTFNSTTGEYNFELLVLYNTVGLIGPATPNANWETDVDMTKDSNDESFWFINSIDLTTSEAKFRAEDAWTVNWGAPVWPSGIGTQDGPNIPITGGTYRVTLNSATGEFAFGDPSATYDLLKSDALTIAPNPARQFVNIQVNAAELRGDAQVILFDQAGKRVLEQQINLQENTTINVAQLLPGNYMMHLSNGKFIVGKSVVIVK